MAEIVDIVAMDLDLSRMISECEEANITVRDLKESIKGFRESLDKTTIGTSEWEKALQNLTTAQDLLKKVTKSSVDVVAGSYNDLTRQMAEMKKEWKNLNPDTKEGQKRMAELGQSIKETNDKLKEMDASLGNYQRNVGNYGSAFEGVSLKIEGTTATFERQINTTQSAIDSFQLIEGAMHAFGVESEEVEKILRTTEGAMKFTQGLKAIKGAVDGFKQFGIASKAAAVEQKALGTATNATTAATVGATVATNTFKTALISTGIGALVVGLGVLIANFDKVLGLFKSNASEADKAAESFGNFKNEVEETARTGATELEIMGVKGATAMQLLQAEIKMTANDLSTLEKKSAELKKNLSDAKWWQFGLKKELKKQIEEVEGMIEETTEKQEDLSEEVKVQQVKDAEEARKAILKNIEESQKAVDTLTSKLKNTKLSAPAIELNKITEQYKKDQETLDTALNRGVITIGEYYEKISQLDEAFVNDRDKIFNSLLNGYDDKLMSDYEKSINTLDNWREAEIKKWNDLKNELLANKNATATDIEEFTVKYEEAMGKISQIFKQENEKIQKEAKDSGWKTIVDTAEKELQRLDRLRDEAIKSLALTETAIREEFEGFDFEMTIDLKYDRQEAQLKKLKGLYEEQLEIQKDLDTKEKERLQTLIDQAIAQGRSTEEVEELRLQMSLVGDETDALSEKLKNVNNTLQTLSAAKFAEEMGVINEMVSSFADIFIQLNDIGGLMGDEVASAVSSALVTVTEGINTAAQDFTDISAMQAKLNEMKKEGVDIAKQDALQADINKKKWQAYGGAVASGFGAASNILSALAEQQDETTREGFEKQKKLAIAAATMSMLQGIVSAWTSAMSLPAPLSFITGGVMTAATATMGALQIANIKKQQFDSSGSSSSVAAPSMPSISAGDLISRPVQTTTQVQGASSESNMSDTRVYVVETDITSTINKVSVAESESTY